VPQADSHRTPPRSLPRPSVQWRDLTALSAQDVATELLISLPWLVVSLLLANAGWMLIALPCSFMFFLTGLRQVHGAFHYSLGLRRKPTELVMLGLSGLMLGSMHAVQFNHLRHHTHCMEEDDVEAMSARMPWWRAVLWGPLFPVRLHLTAWSHARGRQRQWILAELALTIGIVTSAAAIGIGWLRYHVLAMVIGHCLTAFFAVWTVHHDCEETVPARTIRGRLKPFVTYEMFYHLEHHLFPAVPTRRLPELARRLDAVAPELSERRVF
jgi:fatty acid desaturase